MLVHDEVLPGARLLVTGRVGGQSTGAWAELNLGDHVGDAPDVVEANRSLLAAEVGLRRERLLFMKQVHGSDVAVVDSGTQGTPECDAMVTADPSVAVAVLVADCVPVLMADLSAGVVAVAHAGRRGLVAGVLAAAVAAMRSLGARNIIGRLGPSICPLCYPVPPELRTQVAEQSPASAAADQHGRPAIDVAAGVLEQAAVLGVDLQRLPGCTAERADLYSYRRDGVTGRFAGVAMLTGRQP